MNERELKALLAAEISGALGQDDGDLADQRARGMDYYLGDMAEHLPSLDGRSKAVSTDVQDVIESIMPSMLEIFTGTEEPAKFAPVGAEDEAAAEQETDYINHVFYQQCDGFLVLHDLIKDALLQKNGVVKHWWDKSEKAERETYEGLSPDALAMLLTEAEPIEQTSRPDGLVDVTVKRTTAMGRPRIEVVPPGEFLIARDAKTIRDARFVGHRTKKTQSDLIAMGFDRDQVEKLPSFGAVETIEELARRTSTDEDLSGGEMDEVNRAMRLIEIVEAYVRCDWDGDGIAEIRKVTCSSDGSTILDNEPADRAPFSSMAPIRMPHKWLGRSVADIVIELQTIKTAMTRQLLDNLYNINNARTEVPDAAVNEFTIDDILTPKPGGMVRTAAAGMLKPFVTAPIAQHILPAIEYFDTVRETRTGVTRYNQGLDAQSLNKTATGVMQIMSAAQMRLRMIARVFAETGVRDLFLALHELIQKHDRQKHVVRLRGKWVEVDPAQWKTRTDMTISVALGSGGKAEQTAQAQQLLAIQTEGLKLQGGANGPLFTLANVYATIKKLIEAMGWKSADPYVTDPAGQPAPQPPQDPKAQADAARLQLEGEKAKADYDVKLRELALKERELALKEAEMNARVGLDAAKLEQDGRDRAAEREFKAAEGDKARDSKPNGATINLPDSVSGEIGKAMAVLAEPIARLADAAKPRRMRRRPVRDGQGLIVETIDEPIEETMQ